MNLSWGGILLSAISWRPRTVVITVAVLALLLNAQAAGAAPPAGGRATGVGKVAAKVRAEIATKGKATFWVTLSEAADVRHANRLPDKAQKGAYVYRTKTEQAARSQAGLRRLLTERKADFTPFWIVDTVKVTADAALVAEIAARPEVKIVDADQPVVLPVPVRGTSLAPGPGGIEWNVDRVNAPRVWHQLGVHGEGITVASIDTGVDYTHPALAGKYRGRRADGTVDHNYNWFDPAHACPTAAPCDNVGHGTHTMGTMVGGEQPDGADQIGVAPAATWISAKGCESYFCSREALLAAGQWILAPTDLAGRNPRPDLAPDVVNNSWGSGVLDPWYSQIVDSWVAAGIFPAFSNGNAGPACGTTGSPGGYNASYSSGALDADNMVAPFSSRGAGMNGDIKPDIAAPGVDVRSSLPGGAYGSYSGTSMAAPHTAATVALMWSAAPALVADIAATRQILDSTAVDTPDQTCGGTDADNNVYGQGRLDAWAAVQAAPRQAVGALTGNVASDGFPVADATVTLRGPVNRQTRTAADGQYRFARLIAGTYQVTVSAFGFITSSSAVTVLADGTATFVVNLPRAPSATLSGTVRSAAGPVEGATVTVAGTPLSARTDAAGRYRLVAPLGDYQVEATGPDPCLAPASVGVNLRAAAVVDLTLPDRADRFGHTCSSGSGSGAAGTDRLALSGDDEAIEVALPFPVPFYGTTYHTAWVSTNGIVNFTGWDVSLSNTPIPSNYPPNGVLYPFWDDLYVDDQSAVYTATVPGPAGHRGFVVEWRNVAFFGDASQRVSFSVLIGEDGTVTYRYAGGSANQPRSTGTDATIGIENQDGTDALQYAYDTPAVRDGLTITFRPPAG